MDSGEVRVLGAWQSPFVLRARIALNIKGVEYEFIEENLLSKTKSDLLLKSNPIHKKVPVLFHGDRDPICESLVIVQYIDEVWTSGPSILPSDPFDRAIARFWAAYIDDKLFVALKAILGSEGLKAKREAALNETTQIFARLEDAFTKCSKGQKFFGGEKIGYLDIALGCFLVWVRVIQKMANFNLIEEERTPNLFNWAQQFLDDDAVKDVLPDQDKLQEFAKILGAKYKAYANK